MEILTAGQECQQAAKILSSFTDANHSAAIPALLVREAFGMAILKGHQGVAVVRLASGGNLFLLMDQIGLRLVQSLFLLLLRPFKLLKQLYCSL